MKNLFYCLMLIGLLNCQSNSAQTADEILPVEQFADQIENEDVQLLDVRTSKEYSAGHIADAVNMDVLQEDSFTTEIENLDKNAPVYIYCRSGNRSKKAAKILKENGFEKVVDLEGGYKNWKK